jgi:predicted metal-binding membrane protein
VIKVFVRGRLFATPTRHADMTETTERCLTRLSPMAARLGHAFSRPVPIAIGCVVMLAGLGWIYLALLVAGWASRGEAAALGPGMGLIELLSEPGGIGSAGRALVDALCRPSLGQASAWGVEIGLVLLMWVAMAFAMMLPTAGPMIVTYAEIADTAARKGEPAVSPLVLTAGYAGVWLGFAAVATVVQVALTALALLDPTMAAVSPLFSGAVFIGAGAYQFSALKHACVTRCQRPFPFFFANWSTEPRTILRHGIRQGLYCLGCCWATMMVMFAVGVMNVVWMAGLGMIMAAEKLATTTRLSRVIGAVFIAIGAAFIITSIVAHWPVSPR